MEGKPMEMECLGLKHGGSGGRAIRRMLFLLVIPALGGCVHMERTIRMGEAFPLAKDEAVAVAGTGMSVRLIGTSTAHAVNADVIDLATFRLATADGGSREVTLANVNGKPSRVEVDGYILVLESADGYRQNCSIRILGGDGARETTLAIVSRRIRVTDGGSAEVFGITVRISGFVEAFVAGRDGITSSHPDFTVELRSGTEGRTERHCTYGTVIAFQGVRVTVVDCATGTRDFQSFADLKAEKLPTDG
jgi:hypothetical protein